ncbi:MAG TPA: MFS transporter [Kofleriaceae bacterium]|nr:MFS transporter [Kofleriaceae bacterium]
MSKPRVAGRTLALVVVLELVAGACIWFSHSPSADAQPSQSASAAGSAAVTQPAADAPKVVETKDACPVPPKKPHVKKTFTQVAKDDLLPIGILLAVIVLVLWRLPKVELGHTPAFRSRRLLNWLPLGLTYSFLYFARYNIKSFQGVGLTEAEYGTVFGIGSAVYGLAFLINGPLTDRWGGRATILISAAGAGVANLWMGYMAATKNTFGMSVPTAFTAAFAMNMYFQSFGAVSIVKVNAAWFHLRERGTFGGIFGILISLGLYFAFDVIGRIKENYSIQWIFLVPAMILFVFFVLSFVFVRNEPADAGHPNFDLGDATNKADEDTPKLTFWVWLGQIRFVLWKLISHPVLLTIALIELCSGFLRQAILQWGPDFGKGVGVSSSFVFKNWGMVSCIAGITGGMFAGALSDHLFQSRRSPVSAVLYGIMIGGSIMILVLLDMPMSIGWVVAFMSMAIIGVHGMLTATASADFAGKKNTGVAVGLIDGFVYLGSTVQSFVYGHALPASKMRDAANCLVPNPEYAKSANWSVWPIAMIPIAIVGFLLTLRIWNAKPRSGSTGGH